MNDMNKALSDTELLREHSKDRRGREEQKNGYTQVQRGENVESMPSKRAPFDVAFIYPIPFSGSYRVCLSKRPQAVYWDIHGDQLQTLSCTPGRDCSTLCHRDYCHLRCYMTACVAQPSYLRPSVGLNPAYHWL